MAFRSFAHQAESSLPEILMALLVSLAHTGHALSHLASRAALIGSIPSLIAVFLVYTLLGHRQIMRSEVYRVKFKLYHYQTFASLMTERARLI